MCAAGQAGIRTHFIKLVMEARGSRYYELGKQQVSIFDGTTVFSSRIFSYSCDSIAFFIGVTHNMIVSLKTIASYEVERCCVVPFGAARGGPCSLTRGRLPCRVHICPPDWKASHSGAWGRRPPRLCVLHVRKGKGAVMHEWL